jgi:hypothetical protein
LFWIPVADFVYCDVGKPFAGELSSLSTTIQWAREFDIAVIKRFFDNANGETLVAVGVGGSFTAARFAAVLHNERSGPGIAQTTFEFCSSETSLRKAHVVLFTGGGRNRDILNAFDCAISKEAHAILVVCGSLGSLIAARARRYWHVSTAEFELPTRRDGFLATNTLIATCTLLVRAFGVQADAVGFDVEAAAAVERSAYELASHGRDHLIVLAGGYATPAGVDLESKCSEAALASVMLSDFRHFAHGRHVWLAKRPDTAAVIALITSRERDVFKKTQALIPRSVPVIRIAAWSSDSRSTIALLCQVFYFVSGLGKALGRDPGRPGVPPFGRGLYHLAGGRKFSAGAISQSGIIETACERKRSVAGRDRQWPQDYRRFLTALQHARFTAVVFDFDGTLCGARDRFIGVTQALHRPLTRLLRGGVQLVIATGRGDSCREALHKIIPQKFWRRVIVGYHNGSDVSTLADVSIPRADEKALDPLMSLVATLKRRKLVTSRDLRVHRCQLTIKPTDAARSRHVGHSVEEVIAAERLPLRMVYSSHSFDVLACEASKINVLQCGLALGDKALCIGDRGAWPGNDFELLQTPLSLSVDEVSSDPNTCWNLAPAGVRCEQATLFYLLGMEAARGSISFSLDRSLTRFRKSF